MSMNLFYYVEYVFKQIRLILETLRNGKTLIQLCFLLLRQFDDSLTLFKSVYVLIDYSGRNGNGVFRYK